MPDWPTSGLFCTGMKKWRYRKQPGTEIRGRSLVPECSGGYRTEMPYRVHAGGPRCKWPDMHLSLKKKTKLANIWLIILNGYGGAGAGAQTSSSSTRSWPTRFLPLTWTRQAPFHPYLNDIFHSLILFNNSVRRTYSDWDSSCPQDLNWVLVHPVA